MSLTKRYHLADFDARDALMADFTTPILASSMLSHVLLQEKTAFGPIKTGCRAIDDSALEGGFRRGEVTVIAGSGATGKIVTALHAMASHLIQDKTSEAALVDTTGFFSPLRMRDLVMSHQASNLRKDLEQQGYVYRKASSLPHNEHLREMATEVLSRMKVMRVVDLTGIIEALHEIGAACEESQSRSAIKCSDLKDRELQNLSSEIPSSQGDEDEATLDEVETKLDYQTPNPVPVRSIQMLVIDNIANHATAELSNNQIEAQALLTTCMRSLRSVTKQHRLCTIVINDIVGTRPGGGQHLAHVLHEDASVFASVRGRPALGKTFAHLIDTSILIARIPARKRDAQLAMSDEKDHQNAAWKSLLVMEVLYDRYGSRQGRWSAFGIVNGLDLTSDYS